MRAGEESIGFFTKLAAEKLGITKNKLRHLTMALEKHGYQFTRNKSNQRIYFQENLEMIEKLLQKVKNDVTIDEAAQSLCEGKENSYPPAVEETVLPQARRNVFLPDSQIHSMIEQVAASAAEQAANQVMKNFSTELERRIELRDKQLMLRLREMTEEKKRHKKGLFAKILGQ
ncbi:DNA-binding protein [Sporolactobacillus inulinus]|uniref:HTH merR-type domain-containing protein n=2 Tax=Sporolactobacillus inulinus TaxID=2078 RepID=A0A0U1QSP0_9BACL|nr:DNA-binding protein [Sporolactobacillus inulinus]KLI03818.1 hypothetical protein SINU_00710 [Sporolactobacillus inulinus CASD]GEB76101.1 hypothetical protein SIN01_04460 [Sporolactobacillus inulinus]